MKVNSETAPLPSTVFVRVALLRAYIRLHLLVPAIVAVLCLSSPTCAFPLFSVLSMTGTAAAFLAGFVLLDQLLKVGRIVPSLYSVTISRMIIPVWLFCACPVFSLLLGALPEEMRNARIALATMLQGLLVHQTLAFVPRFWVALGYIVGPGAASFFILLHADNTAVATLEQLLATHAYYFLTYIILKHLPRNPEDESGCQTDPLPAEPPPPPVSRETPTEFFDQLPYPVFLVDVDINVPADRAPLMNQKARELLSACGFAKAASLFDSMLVTSSSQPVSEAIGQVRKKMEQKCFSRGCVTLCAGSVKCTCDATVFSFDHPGPGQGRFAGVVIVPNAKDPVEEKRIMENFKSSLICSLSHELCTPINTILNLLKTMASSPSGSEDNRELCEIAASNTELLNSKLQDLIDYTQIEVHSFRPMEHNFCVNELFEELEKIFKYETEEKGNRLLFDINSKGKLWIMADRGRIRQILIKLLINANKYTTKGSITVSANEKPQDFDVVFQVRDTGAGISKQQLDLIFSNASETARIQTNQRVGSTKLPGLGLAIARKICEGMNSRLRARSVPGEGSFFYFEIPICRMPCGDRSGDVEEGLGPHGRIRLFRQFTQRSNSNKRLNMVLPQKPEGRRDRPGLTGVGWTGPGTPKPKQAAVRTREGENQRRPTEEEDKEHAKEKTKDDVASTSSYGSTSTEAAADKRQAFGRRPYKHQVSEYFAESRGKRLSKMKLEVTEGPQCVRGTEPPKTRREGVVIIADDYAGNRLVLVQMLGRLKVKSVEAGNGQEACKLVGKHLEDPTEAPIDLILMDLDMPVMDGIQATMKIRGMEEKLRRDTRIPIVAVTAFNSENDRQMCFEAGMQHFVPKPVQYAALKSLLTTYCQVPAAV